MNIPLAAANTIEATSSNVHAIADCDVHPLPNDTKDLYPYLATRWRTHLDEYGLFVREPGVGYPKAQPSAARRDAWPEDGSQPGSRLDLMQKQHLDAYQVQLGVMTTLWHPGGVQHPELSAALCRAVNDWQKEEWTGQDPRLRASIVVAYEHGDLGRAEIERWAGNPDFVQVLLLGRTAAPLGQRRYWPIYEAAEEAGLPVGIHSFGWGGYPITSGGWPSFYIEEMVGLAQCAQSQLISLVLEGVFQRFPGLRIVVIESGFGWFPPLAWRLDRHWQKLRSETPHLEQRPSDYLRNQVWLTTQPMEEAETRQHVVDVCDWIGWDKLLFASDYPHWDFDDPKRCLPMRISDEQARMFFLDNALGLYGVG